MYLSRLIISNYRSIKELELKFEKGKNVIVGKNNAGKSNIIRAIDLILGENSPTYAKSENITENDFHNGDTANEIYIYLELKRDENEQLNFTEINKCFGYRIHATRGQYQKVDGVGFYAGEPIRHRLRNEVASECIVDMQALMDISEEDAEGSTIYINPKLRNQATFEGQLNDKQVFAFTFRAYMSEQGKILKEIRFFYRESETVNWVMAFAAPIRNELLQSAIIHSFRDPQNELRINQWSWFGKLLKNYIQTNDPDLKAAFEQVRTASNGVFNELQTELNDSRIQVAFPDTEVSFRFNPETKMDIYKSALIYVNDGYNSLLQDKGSGIQSAVIIGLFNFYTSKLVPSSSLLAVEEPEIYLHPQARRVISHRIDDFLNGNRNQVIITTHSTEFITSAHENLNVVVVSKNQEAGTTARNTKFETSKEKQILVKVQNAEMFFADKVILVEGGEKYILESVASYFGKNIYPELGPNWLNEMNISVISVGGKTEFGRYVKKLNELGIPVFVMADFDFLLRKLPEFMTETDALQDEKDALNAFKSKIDHTGFELSRRVLEQINAFKSSLEGTGLSVDEQSLKKYLKEPFRLKRLMQFSVEKQGLIRDYLNHLTNLGIHILSGELEDFYKPLCTEKCRRVSGKEEKAIYIVSRLVTEDNPITSYIVIDEYVAVLEAVTGVTRERLVASQQPAVKAEAIKN